MKRFPEWIKVKTRLDKTVPRLPPVREGDIWWVSLGENVGREMNGKSELFVRPVIIYKKLALDFYFVIPLTTRPHEGNWFVSLRGSVGREIACIHQSRSVDARRFSTKVGFIYGPSMKKLKIAFRNLYA